MNSRAIILSLLITFAAQTDYSAGDTTDASVSALSGNQLNRFNNLYDNNIHSFETIFDNYLEAIEKSDNATYLATLLPTMEWICSLDPNKYPNDYAVIIRLQGDATRVAANLAMKSETTDSLRLETFTQIVRFISKVQTLIIPNFKPYSTSLNIEPPDGVAPAFAGMDPSQIADPKLRQYYQNAIDENNTHLAINSNQLMWRNLFKVKINSLNEFANEVNRNNPAEGKAFYQILKEYKLLL